jgi:hypothetical protein
LISLNDSRVVVGAFSKGRSSSFKLNGILRSLVPFLVLGNLKVVLLWVETESNLADHPSRFRPLPPPKVPPFWVQKLGIGNSLQDKVGWEVFAGTGRVTIAHRRMGCAMRAPVEILNGSDAFDQAIDEALCRREVGWLWLAPPCGSFSPPRNLDKGGPLRPRGRPAGDESVPAVKEGSRLWRRALDLARKAIDHDVHIFLEHPAASRAWLMSESRWLFEREGLWSAVVHWCAYADPEREGPPNRKPARIVTSAPWLAPAVRKCPGDHVHGRPLRGVRAKQAGAYPWEFCDLLAAARFEWENGAAGPSRPQSPI